MGLDGHVASIFPGSREVHMNSSKVISTEKKLFRLRFKKATQQQFKTHEIKSAKRTLKQLKSILTLRLNKLSELDCNNVAINLIQQQLLKEKSLNN